MNELKPCPFCGSMRVTIIGDRHDKDIQVQCFSCYASTGVNDTEKEAVKFWNMRKRRAGNANESAD